MRDGRAHGRFGVIAAAILLSGCQSWQVAHDGEGFRCALLDMYTDQAMDNLIRAHEGMPFVQLSYRDLLVQDTDTYMGGATATWSESGTGAIDRTKSILSSFTRMFGHGFSANGSASRAKIMSFHADPITDKNDIYQAYLTFANDPSLFVASDKPAQCPVHIARKHGGRYYWIPAESGQAFLELTLKTTFMRGPDTTPPGAYEVQILDVRDIKVLGKVGIRENDPADVTNGYLIISTEVPNGDATLEVVLQDGRKVRHPIKKVDKNEKGEDIKDGDPTKRLFIQWSPTRSGFTEHNLIGRKALIYSYNYPPELRKVDPTVQKIADNVDQIRANQKPGSP